MTEDRTMIAVAKLHPADLGAILRAARRLEAERLAARMEELGLRDLAQRLRRRSTPRALAR